MESSVSHLRFLPIEEGVWKFCWSWLYLLCRFGESANAPDLIHWWQWSLPSRWLASQSSARFLPGKNGRCIIFPPEREGNDGWFFAFSLADAGKHGGICHAPASLVFCAHCDQGRVFWLVGIAGGGALDQYIGALVVCLYGLAKRIDTAFRNSHPARIPRCATLSIIGVLRRQSSEIF